MTDAILGRIRKLLELSKSDNVNEATNAAMLAQQMMAKHNIDEAALSVDAQEAEQEAVEDDILIGGKTRIPTWRKRLASVVARANLCEIYFHGADIRIVGTPRDASTARYLFTWLTREINRLCEQATFARALEQSGSNRIWANNFRLGAIVAVHEKLAAANEEARKLAKREAVAGDTLGNGTALVRVNSALARLDERRAATRTFMGKLRLRAGRGTLSRRHGDGQAAGYRAGKSIDVSRGSNAALPSGNRKQLGR